MGAYHAQMLQKLTLPVHREFVAVQVAPGHLVWVRAVLLAVALNGEDDHILRKKRDPSHEQDTNRERARTTGMNDWIQEAPCVQQLRVAGSTGSSANQDDGKKGELGSHQQMFDGLVRFHGFQNADVSRVETRVPGHGNFPCNHLGFETVLRVLSLRVYGNSHLERSHMCNVAVSAQPPKILRLLSQRVKFWPAVDSAVVRIQSLNQVYPAGQHGL